MTQSPTETPPTTGVAMTDPRAPRFGQLITASLLTIGILLQQPLLIAFVAGILLTAVLSKWRLHPYAILWQHLIVPLVGRSNNPEPAAPHRFATLLGATFTTTATALLYSSLVTTLPVLEVAGYGIAAIVALLAATAAIADYCIGCKLYTQVAYVRNLNLV